MPDPSTAIASTQRPAALRKASCGIDADASAKAATIIVEPVLLYNSQVSGNCYKVRLLLAHLGLAYERREVSTSSTARTGREVLGELNPALRVPTLVLDDGRPLAESDAILFYLAEGTPYLPEDRYERAQVLQWLFFEQYNHEPNIAVVRFWVAMRRRTAPRGRARGQAPRRLRRARRDGAPPRRAARSSSASATRSPTSRSTPTRTSRTRAASTSSRYPAIRAWLERVATQPGHVGMAD